jgi:hypothetical protein
MQDSSGSTSDAFLKALLNVPQRMSFSDAAGNPEIKVFPRCLSVVWTDTWPKIPMTVVACNPRDP